MFALSLYFDRLPLRCNRGYIQINEKKSGSSLQCNKKNLKGICYLNYLVHQKILAIFENKSVIFLLLSTFYEAFS